MTKKNLIFIFVLLLSNSLGNIKEEIQLSKENSGKESLRKLEGEENYIIAYFGEVSQEVTINFQEQESHNNIYKIYLNDSDTPY